MSEPTITDFLEARIAEDEADARGALGLHWDGSAYQQVRTVSGDDPHYYKVASGQVGLEHWEPRERLNPGTTFAHIARHDPARVLAECAAKRAIIGLHVPVDYSGIGMTSPNACSICGAERSMSDWEWVLDSFPCETLQALAAVYADHPDYQQEWAL